MATAEALLTAEEFGRRPDPGYPEELVQGRIITMAPLTPRHGQVCIKVIRFLDRHVDEHAAPEVSGNAAPGNSSIAQRAGEHDPPRTPMEP